MKNLTNHFRVFGADARFIGQNSETNAQTAEEAELLVALKESTINEIDNTIADLQEDLDENKPNKEKRLRKRKANREAKGKTPPVLKWKSNREFLADKDAVRDRIADLEERKRLVAAAESKEEIDEIMAVENVEDYTKKESETLATEVATESELEEVSEEVLLENLYQRYLLTKYIIHPKDGKTDYANVLDSKVQGERLKLNPYWHVVLEENKDGEKNEYRELNAAEKAALPTAEYRAKMNDLLVRLEAEDKRNSNIEYSETAGSLARKAHFEYVPAGMSVTDEAGEFVSSIDKVIVDIVMNADGTSTVNVQKEFGTGDSTLDLVDTREHMETLTDEYDYTTMKQIRPEGAAKYQLDSARNDGISDVNEKGEDYTHINNNSARLDEVARYVDEMLSA